jgi:hypothetical protein
MDRQCIVADSDLAYAPISSLDPPQYPFYGPLSTDSNSRGNKKVSVKSNGGLSRSTLDRNPAYFGC